MVKEVIIQIVIKIIILLLLKNLQAITFRLVLNSMEHLQEINIKQIEEVIIDFNVFQYKNVSFINHFILIYYLI